ncbi:MAG TPA: hypothetical protein VMT55_04215, partial [Candidatus Sulfotelmatobacter sp.]|nr:hypothetical protein [Candidatus Sulfotelmatobacter sp.]
ISASIARVPWLGLEFNGFIIGLRHGGKLYRFTTYTGAKIKKIAYKENGASFEAEDRDYILDVEGVRGKGDGVELAAPVSGEMRGRIKESLPATVRVTLYSKVANGRAEVFFGVGKWAGMERVGKLAV